jgi:hypothetical protein
MDYPDRCTECSLIKELILLGKGYQVRIHVEHTLQRVIMECDSILRYELVKKV